jgi:hypothetical protein
MVDSGATGPSRHRIRRETGFGVEVLRRPGTHGNRGLKKKNRVT